RPRAARPCGHRNDPAICAPGAGQAGGRGGEAGGDGMTTKRTKTKTVSKRPARAFSIPDDYDELVAWVAAERERPIAKAYGKLFDFVNGAVSDPDFRHPDSRALLDFLLLVRDEMTDGINEQWDVD